VPEVTLPGLNWKGPTAGRSRALPGTHPLAQHCSRPAELHSQGLPRRTGHRGKECKEEFDIGVVLL